MDNDREKDIQELCKQVLELSAEVSYSWGGYESSRCPLCGVKVNYEEYDMSKLEHNSNCGYLIAKDLSTNLQNNK